MSKNLVYLCENEFAKFRKIYENMKRGRYSSYMKSAAKLENKFLVMKGEFALHNVETEISFENENVDFNFFNCVEVEKLGDIKYFSPKISLFSPKREMIFLVSTKLLTVIV